MYNEYGEHCKTDPRSVLVLWPDGPRWVAAERVIGWAYDSWYDNADWHRCCACGGPVTVESAACDHFADAKPIHNDSTPEPRSLEEAMDWLSSTGEATFGRDQPADEPEPEEATAEARLYREATDDECDRREP